MRPQPSPILPQYLPPAWPQVSGTHEVMVSGTHRLATPPAPQVDPAGQAPQSWACPQPSPMVPQKCAAPWVHPCGVQPALAGGAHTCAMPAPLQAWPVGQSPHSRTPPQPSPMRPQNVVPPALQPLGVQASLPMPPSVPGGITGASGGRTIASIPGVTGASAVPAASMPPLPGWTAVASKRRSEQPAAVSATAPRTTSAREMDRPVAKDSLG
jgi:hypothetical protein